MSEYEIAECIFHGSYAKHLGSCPVCDEQPLTDIIYNGADERETIRKELKEAGLLGGDFELPQESKALEALGVADLPPVSLPSKHPKEVIYRDEASLYFVIEGEPIPKERPRVSKGKAYTPDNTKQYKALVQQSAVLAMRGKIPSNRLIYLDIEFRRKNEVKADVDNLSKAIMDACNKILWKDDKQVRRLVADVSYGWGDNACAIVRVYESVL